MNNDQYVFTTSCTFDAPRDLVWKAYTDAEQLKRWFGPKDFPVFSSQLDLRPQGEYHYGMRGADGAEMWGKWVFREIEAPEKLVFVVHFSDAEGNITRHPGSKHWPLETLSTITFEEHQGKTTVKVKWEALNATAQETQTFKDGSESMEMGLKGTFEQLAAYLKEL